MMRFDARAFVAVAAGQIGADNRQWIEVMPTATEAKNGPWKFTITRDDLDAYAKSIQAGAGNIPIDYDHAGAREDGSTKAAGWFTGQARIEDRDGSPVLMAEVEWTPSGAQAIRDGDFKMISPEFSFHDKDKKTGLMTRAKAIIAATLTNRPFFRELAPVAADLTGDEDEAVLALAEALDLSPMEIVTLAASSMQPYGDVDYADPGYQTDKKKRYPLDTDAHIRAAWAYINKAKNAEPYSAEQLASIKSKIRAAMKRIGADVTATNEGDDMDLKVFAAALGLPETATEDEIKTAVEAAKKTSDEAAAVAKELEELKAAGSDKSELDKLREELDTVKTERLTDQRDTLLAKAVEDRKIEPAQKEVLAETFGTNIEGLEKVLATFTPKPKTASGTGGAGASDDVDPVTARQVERLERGGFRVTDDSATDVHVKAVKLLKERGKHTYSADEYLAACEEIGEYEAGFQPVSR